MSASRKVSLAVIGARGLIGAEFLAILERRRFAGNVSLISVQPKSGGQVKFRGRSLKVTGFQEFLKKPQPVDILVSLAETDWSKKHLDRFFGCAGVIVDESSAFRLNPDVPLIIPEINGRLLENPPRLIASPNCTTVIAALGAAPIIRKRSVKRMILASYQAASGAGREAWEGFEGEIKAMAAGKNKASGKFPRLLAGNAIPQIGAFDENGFSEEERKVIAETKKIFDQPDLAISATCVRVPVRVGHSVAIWLELDKPITDQELRGIYRDSAEVAFKEPYPTPLDCARQEGVFAGRLRIDPVWPGGVSLWACGDNLIKGGAQNVWQIVERVLGGQKNGAM